MARFLLLSLLLLASCSMERRFDVRGRVVGFGDDGHTVIVAHEDIPSFMPAMTMPFASRDTLPTLAHGDPIGFTLIVTRKDSWIEDLHAVPDSTVSPADVQKKADVAVLDVGDPLPPLSLVDEEGRSFSLPDAYRGKTLVVDFIYTRCPLPDYCPLLSRRFAELHERFASDTTVALLSVTLDPEYDTPEILRQYRARYTSAPGGWHFATGTPAQVEQVWALLGQYVIGEGEGLQHNLVAVVIGPDGRVRRYFRGQDWTVDAVAEAINAAKPA